LEVANFNKIGEDIKNSGILILMVMKDRKTRIDIGYGLENVITDDIAGSILHQAMFPYFKQGKYVEGLNKGIEEIKKILYQKDVKHFFTMKWDIQHFEEFIDKYPKSVLRCDALMFLGRFYEDLWNKKLIKRFGEENRKKSVEYYKKYLKECPDGIWRATVEYELSLVQAKKTDSKRYLISD